MAPKPKGHKTPNQKSKLGTASSSTSSNQSTSHPSSNYTYDEFKNRHWSGSVGGGGGSSTSSSGGSFGRSTFYDLELDDNSRDLRSRTDTSTISPFTTRDEPSVLENILNYDLASLPQNQESNLEIGSRVVWLRESPLSTEAGVVRWLGNIDGEEIAGIEFDNQLNIGSGWFRNKQLFHCKPEHGGLVAVIGLIFEQDLQVSQLSLSPPSESRIQQYSSTSCQSLRRELSASPTHSRDQASQPFAVLSSDEFYKESYNPPHQYLINPSGIMPSLPFLHPPLRTEDVERIDGRNKGIQGHRNSCYLDATLFSMFSFTSVFDSILVSTCGSGEIGFGDSLAQDVQNILRDEIVYPLRKDLFTPARNVMKLRERMQHLDPKLTSEEMDPQEFLEILFNRVLHLDGFLSLNSGQSDFFHQILFTAESKGRGYENKIPTVQELLEHSLRDQKLKFTKIPSPVLILQTPRSGSKYKMFKGILPNITIDVTDLIENTPRTCIICGNLATDDCPECCGLFGVNDVTSSGSRTPLGSAAFSTAFCRGCVQLVHSRADRRHHTDKIEEIKYSFDTDQFFPKPPPFPQPSSNGLSSTANYYPASAYFSPDHHQYGLPSSTSLSITSARSIPRVTMDLFAVICIETSHFVSFVKCGEDRFAPWAFFDSMADRTENFDGSGHNIPQVKILPQMGKRLDELELNPLSLNSTLETLTPDLKRLLADPYICLYYSRIGTMYN